MKSVILFCLLLTLSGCGETLNFFSKQEEKPKLDLSVPNTIDLKPIEWVVVTEENISEQLERINNRGQDPVLFALTEEGYENLSLNFAELRNLILLNRKIIEQYKKYYEGEQNVSDKQ